VAVPRFPIFYRKDFSQRHFAFERRFGVYEFEPVADAVDMNVHADGRQLKTDCDGEIRRFPADAGKLAQFLYGVRKNSVEFFFQYRGQGFEMAGFGAEKPDGVDKTLNFSGFERFKTFRGSAAGGKKPAYGTCRAGVFRPSAQDGADEDFERVVCLRVDKFDDGGLLFLIFSFESFID
jgi:hypothetical protein